MSDLSRLLDDVYRSGPPAATPKPAARPELEEALAEWDATEPEVDEEQVAPAAPAARTALEEAFADWEETEPVADTAPDARSMLEEAFADWDEPEPIATATPARSALEAALAELDAHPELAEPGLAPVSRPPASTPEEVDQLQDLLERLAPLAGPDVEAEDEPVAPVEMAPAPAAATPVDSFLADIDTLLAEPPLEAPPVAPVERVLPPSPELAEALQSVLNDAVEPLTPEPILEAAPAMLEEVAMDAGNDDVEPAFVPPVPVQAWSRQDDDILPPRGRRRFSRR